MNGFGDLHARLPGSTIPVPSGGKPVGLTDKKTDPAALSRAEARRRRRELFMAAALILAIATLFVVGRHASGFSEELAFGDNLLFLFLNALNVILVVLLVYLIARNFVKLVFERRKGILGSHLNLKFVLAFFVVATIPTAVVFLASYYLVTASIETWFGLQVDRALERSREVADAYYDAYSVNALHYGEQIAAQIRAGRLLREGRQEVLAGFVQAKQREYNLGVVQIFPYAEAEPLATFVNPEIPDAAFLQRESPIVRSALEGSAGTVVDATGTDVGDVIRGAVPIFSSDTSRPDEIVGAVVVNYLVPHALAYKVEEIRETVGQYREVQPYAGHIAWVYQLELLLFSLVILLFAIWWGFRMARGVTGPISALAAGTEEVARGNLDVVVEKTSDDEVGLLVRSFNQMTGDLRDALEGLERTNTELEQRRRYMEIVLRNIGAGVVSIDAERRISTINPFAQRLLGIPAGEGVVGRKVEDVLIEPDMLEVVQNLALETRAGLRESARQQLLLPRGEAVLTVLVTYTVLHEDGRPIGAVVVLDDYTQEVRAQRMAAWREVARRIAHEIKNPLTPIQLSAQRLRRRFADRVSGDREDERVFDECVTTITSQVDSLKLLVNEFSNFARLPTAKPRPGDLNELVREAAASYVDSDGVNFELDLDGDLPSVDFDREQLGRVLTNLIENATAAVREAPGQGLISIRTRYDAPLQTVRLEVADDGLGISPEDRARIFEPYYSTKSHGTGLGLAIVSRIVADHHGYIRVHENQPQGARFIVELPVKVT